MTKNNEQREMPLLCEVPHPIDLPMRVIERCSSKEDAVLECWNHRRDKTLTQTTAAKRMGMSKAQFTKLLAGQSGFRGTQESAFQRICGNRAITQYQAWELGCQLVDELWVNRQPRERVAA